MEHQDRLFEYLQSDQRPDDSMALSDFDGFLHGLACTPVHLEQWQKVAFGNTDGVPAEILKLAEQRLSEIQERLAAGREAEPVFWQMKEGHVIAMDWCEGFMDAVKASHKVWDEFAQTSQGSKLMTPFLVHMIDDEGNSMFGIAQEDLDQTLDAAAQTIPKIVPQIYHAIRM